MPGVRRGTGRPREVSFRAVNRILIEAPPHGTSDRGVALRPSTPFLRRARWTALILLFVGVRPAHAYLDPGNGSMLLQLLLGGVAGAAVVARLAWQRIVSFFRPGAAGRPETKTTSEGDDPENGAH